MTLFPGYPGFVPGVLAAIAISTATCAPVAHVLRISRVHAFGLLMSVGLILAATLFPDLFTSQDVRATATQRGLACDLDRVGPASFAELLELHETTWNVLLFMPLGLFVALLPRGRRAPALALTFVFPFAIEVIQMVFPLLGRACQSADVADNLTGLLIGLAMGLGVSRLREDDQRP